MRKRKAPCTVNTATAMSMEALKGAEPKKRMSTIGSADRRSTTTKAARPAAAAPARTSTGGEDQPISGPSMRAPTTPARNTIMSSWPAGSRRRGRGARDSGTNSAVATIAATHTGTFSQKLASQPKASVSRPPAIGPSPSDTPLTAPHTPMARARAVASV